MGPQGKNHLHHWHRPLPSIKSQEMKGLQKAPRGQEGENVGLQTPRRSCMPHLFRERERLKATGAARPPKEISVFTASVGHRAVRSANTMPLPGGKCDESRRSGKAKAISPGAGRADAGMWNQQLHVMGPLSQAGRRDGNLKTRLFICNLVWGLGALLLLLPATRLSAVLLAELSSIWH